MTFPCLCLCCCVDRETCAPRRGLSERLSCCCEDRGFSRPEQVVAALYDLGGPNRAMGDYLLGIWHKAVRRVTDSYDLHPEAASAQVNVTRGER